MEQARRWLEQPGVDDRGNGQQAIRLILDETAKVADELGPGLRDHIMGLAAKVEAELNALVEVGCKGEVGYQQFMAMAKSLAGKFLHMVDVKQGALVNRAFNDFMDISTPLKQFTDFVLHLGDPASREQVLENKSVALVNFSNRAVGTAKLVAVGNTSTNRKLAEALRSIATQVNSLTTQLLNAGKIRMVYPENKGVDENFKNLSRQYAETITLTKKLVDEATGCNGVLRDVDGNVNNLHPISSEFENNSRLKLRANITSNPIGLGSTAEGSCLVAPPVSSSCGQISKRQQQLEDLDLLNGRSRQPSCLRAKNPGAKSTLLKGGISTARDIKLSGDFQSSRAHERLPSLSSSFEALKGAPHLLNTTENKIQNIRKCEKSSPLEINKELFKLGSANITHPVRHRQRKLKITERNGVKVKQNPRPPKESTTSDLQKLSNYVETSSGASFTISWDQEESSSETPLEDIKLLFEHQFCDDDLIDGAKSNIKTQMNSENALERGTNEFFDKKEELYEKFVNALYGEEPCSSLNCKKSSDVKCGTCGPLCQNHDVEIHHAATDHERFCGPSRLPPGLTTDGQTFKKFAITIPVNESMKHKLCLNCGTNLIIMPDQNSTIKVVDVSGVYNASTIHLQCPACNTARPMSIEDYFGNFLFPINGDPYGKVVATFAVLRLWRNLKNADGSLGLCTFLKSINKNGICILNQMEFDLLYQQWRHLMYLHSKQIGESYQDCPAKDSESTRLHTDGLLKLTRFYNKNHRTIHQQSYFGNAIIVERQGVTDTVKVFKKHGYVSGGDDRCGISQWTAAENREKGSPVIDETGMVLTTCSHYFTLSAVDMDRGEIYALNNVGIMDVKKRGYEIKECNLDIACKYEPWQSKVNKDDRLNQDLPYDPSLTCKLCVGDFHAKGHSLWCKINHSHQWNGIGRASGGEQTEVLNSPLSQLRHRERFMKPTRRRDDASEFILERNEARDGTVVDETIAKLEQYEKELDKIDSELSKLTSRNKITVNQSLINVLKDSAKTIMMSNKSKPQEKIEFLVMSLLSKRAQWKSTVDLGLRLKVKGNVESVTKKLNTEIDNYNRENDTDITFDDALDGFLPWTVKYLPETIRKNPVLFLKGAELFLKKQRTLEEIDILNSDLVIIIKKRDGDVKKLQLEMNNLSQGSNIRKAMAFKVMLLNEQMKQEISALKHSKAKKSREQVELLQDYRNLGSKLQEKENIVHEKAIDFLSLLPEDLSFSLDLDQNRCSTPVTIETELSDKDSMLKASDQSVSKLSQDQFDGDGDGFLMDGDNAVNVLESKSKATSGSLRQNKLENFLQVPEKAQLEMFVAPSSGKVSVIKTSLQTPLRSLQSTSGIFKIQDHHVNTVVDHLGPLSSSSSAIVSREYQCDSPQAHPRNNDRKRSVNVGIVSSQPQEGGSTTMLRHSFNSIHSTGMDSRQSSEYGIGEARRQDSPFEPSEARHFGTSGPNRIYQANTRCQASAYSEQQSYSRQSSAASLVAPHQPSSTASVSSQDANLSGWVSKNNLDRGVTFSSHNADKDAEHKAAHSTIQDRGHDISSTFILSGKTIPLESIEEHGAASQKVRNEEPSEKRMKPSEPK